MYWNHRVMIRHHEDYDLTTYGIREVYYDDDDGAITAWTVDDMDPHGETLEELRADLERMLACCDKPVLDEREEMKRIEAREQEAT